VTEWNAQDYHRQSSLQEAMAEEQLGLITLEGTERILDVGCGDGKVTAKIAARVPRGTVLGVDPSKDMITFASRQFGAPVHPNLRFEVADARRLSYREEFDLVVSFNALHWVPEQGAALDSIRAALKPRGRTLLRFVPEGPRPCLEDVIEQVRRQPQWARYFPDFQRPYAHFTPAEYQLLAEQRGFQILRIQTEDKVWDFKTRDAFFGFCRATFVAWTRHLAEGEWSAFITDVLDRYRTVAACTSEDMNAFKFYQMDVVLTPA
jgi:trans-aconitate methyltransferase